MLSILFRPILSGPTLLLPFLAWLPLVLAADPAVAQSPVDALVAQSPATAEPGPLADIDEYIERGMRDWAIPGLAAAVVQGNQVVLARGYGVQRLGSSDGVDEHTIFGIASLSKAFTSAALGMLVDEGRLSWDDPVSNHLPDFQLYDPCMTAATTVRDLLAHRVGIGRMTGNRLPWLSNRDRSELVRRIRHLEPEQPFRSDYVYSNVGYLIAGELIPAITGQSWDRFVAERIFAPLGMDRSSTSITVIGPDHNAAWPHQEIDGRLVTIPRRDFDVVGPAASINSSVAELTTWMRMHLGDLGEVDGQRLLSDSVMAQIHQPQNLTPGPALAPPTAYAMGWGAADHAGRRISRHSGATDGMNSIMVLLPEADLGVVVLTNTFNEFMNALAFHIIDNVIGAPGPDWHSLYLTDYRHRHEQARQEREAIHQARERGTRPSVALEGFAGHYYDDLYADARVWLENGSLVLELWGDSAHVADLEHWHHDTFRAVWRNRAKREEFLWFTRGADGSMSHLHVDWALRPDVLQVGAYPSSYRRVATWERTAVDSGS